MTRRKVGTAPGIEVDENDRPVFDTASDELSEDIAAGPFLDFIQGSINTASDFPDEMLELVKTLTADVQVDIGGPIEGDVVI